MKIGLVLSNTPAYSETFFNSKIKGLQFNGMEVNLFVQNKKKDFNLCPVIKTAKVYKNHPLLQTGMFLWVFLTLIPHLSNVWNYVKLEKKQKSSFLKILKRVYLNSALLKQKLDWLHFGFATQAIGSELVAEAIGAKMAVSFRGFDINVYPLKHPNCYNLLWQQLDKVHSISNYLFTKAQSLGLSKNLPFAIITPAVDLKAAPQINKLRSDKIQIVTIARLSWIKGLNVAIEAMKYLSENNIDFEYHIIGTGAIYDFERYKFQTYEYGLKNQIKFLGKFSHQETLRLLSQSDIYLQPSLNEGFCNAVLESQALGEISVVTNVGGLSENIIDKKTGWLTQNMNAKKMANKIINVINLPVSEKQQISENAINRVKTLFTIEQQQKKFIEFYKD